MGPHRNSVLQLAADFDQRSLPGEVVHVNAKVSAGSPDAATPSNLRGVSLAALRLTCDLASSRKPLRG